MPPPRRPTELHSMLPIEGGIPLLLLLLLLPLLLPSSLSPCSPASLLPLPCRSCCRLRRRLCLLHWCRLFLRCCCDCYGRLLCVRRQMRVQGVKDGFVRHILASLGGARVTSRLDQHYKPQPGTLVVEDHSFGSCFSCALHLSANS